MSYIAPEASQDIPTEAREVYDVSGAGDTVVATLAAALAAGIPLQMPFILPIKRPAL